MRVLNSKFLAKNAIFGKLGVDLGGYVPISSRFGIFFEKRAVILFFGRGGKGGYGPPPKRVEEEGAPRDKPKENCIGTGPASTENPSASGGLRPPDPLLVFFT